MTLSIGAIILSRYDSTRLPGKALRKVKNKTLIEYVLEKALRISGISGVCIATSGRKIDEPIAKFCYENDVKWPLILAKSYMSRGFDIRSSHDFSEYFDL